MPEIISIVLLALVALLIIGPRRLPESIESLWLALTDFRRVQSGQQPLGSLHNARRYWITQKSNIYAGIQILYQVTVHLEELRRRILYVLVAFGIGFGLAFAFAQPLLGYIIRPIRIIAPTVQTNVPLNNYIVLQDIQFNSTIVTATGPISGTITIPTGTILPIGLTNTTPIVSAPTELFSTYVKIALVAGFATALPMIMWQVLLFLRGPKFSVATISNKEWQALRDTLSPEDRAEMEKQRHDVYEGLTAEETRPMFLMLPLALILFAGGVLFTYFLLLPSALDFLFGLGGTYVQPLPSLADYMDFALSLIFWIGLTFELPLIMFFLARFRIVSARKFAQQWRFAVVIIVIIAAVITPTVDPLNMALVALPMIGLYVLGIASRGSPAPDPIPKRLSRRQLPQLDVRRVLVILLAFSVIAYSVAMCAWFALRLQFGDSHTWLALANAFALYLFAPLVILVPLILLVRRYLFLPFLLIPLALFFVLFGAQFLPHSPRYLATQPTLRVMTFNVFGNSEHPELASTLIESENPDLVLIQELSPRHSYDITGRLGARYPYRHFEPLYGRRGIGILSRYPMESRGWLQLGRDPYAAQRVTLDWEGRAVHVINVHLESTMPSENVNASFRERERQLGQLLELVSDERVPTIVAGDFNMTDTTQGYTVFASQLNDAYRQAGWGLGLTFPTNPEFLRTILTGSIARSLRTHPGSIASFLRSVYIPPLPLLRLDYVFTTPGLSATNAYVAGWDGQSDHRAVIADLQADSTP